MGTQIVITADVASERIKGVRRGGGGHRAEVASMQLVLCSLPRRVSRRPENYGLI